MSQRWRRSWVVGCVALGISALLRAPAFASGVVVESVDLDSAGSRAGVLAGDLVLEWQRSESSTEAPVAARGDFRSPFDVDDIETSEAPLGRIALVVEGKSGRKSLALPPGDWGIHVRPRFQGSDEADWAAGAAGLAAADGSLLAASVECLTALAGRQESVSPDVALWIWLRLADGLHRRGDCPQAHALATAALEAAERCGLLANAARGWIAEGQRFDIDVDPGRSGPAFLRAIALRHAVDPDGLAVAEFHNTMGRGAMSRGDLETATERFRRALEIRRRLAPDSLALAASFNNCAIAARSRGDLMTAESYHTQAVAIRERLVPDSLLLAWSYNSLGVVALSRGQLQKAEAEFRRALEIRQRLAPDSFDFASSLTNLGVLSIELGDLSGAEDFYRRSLAIQRRLNPKSLGVADLLNNLGNVAWSRGDLASAEDFHRQALALREQLAPGSSVVALSAGNLGLVARDRGDHEQAQRFQLQALALWEASAPDSIGVASALNNLGILAEDRGDVEAAQDLHRRALAIYERQVPDSTSVAMSHKNLATLALQQGSLDEAETHFERSREIYDRDTPDSLPAISMRINLAVVALSRGDAPEAIRLSIAARDRIRISAPDSRLAAVGHQRLALAYFAQGQVGLALDSYCEAIEALEAQRGRLGGSEDAKASFAAGYQAWYREYADWLVAAGLPAEAFYLLERSRARALLSLIAERDLVFGADIPPALERERKLAAADYDRLQARRADAAGRAGDNLEAIDAELRDVRRRQDEIHERIRAIAPRLASLVRPEPLDLAAVQRDLEPGLLVLFFSLGESSSRLFMIERDRFGVADIRRGRSEIAREVQKFRRAIESEGVASGARFTPSVTAIRAQAERLTTLLLGPAAEPIARAARILVVPDGPLHRLPFAALFDPSTAGQRQLIESKPLSTVVSMTVHRELSSDRARATNSVVAFGDPEPPGLTAGLHLAALPWSRAEVAAIRQLAPDRTAVYLGADASESRAKAIPSAVGIVHFACHGMIDEERPLDSALALAASGSPALGSGENGLLQAWEIFEQVRLDADLVALSACETAAGRELGGEGLVGLVRAFQFAGARSVLASLWSVADESTKELMTEFYRHRFAGLSKDEALRRAQVALARGAYPAPFHWAAFELIGDWR